MNKEQLKSAIDSNDMEAVKELFARYLSGKQVFIVWDIDDVLTRADDLGKAVTEKQAVEILALCEDRLDCNYGFTWELIDFCTDSIID